MNFIQLIEIKERQNGYHIIKVENIDDGMEISLMLFFLGK